MDRLRYQATVRPGEPNRAPAVEFLRKAMAAEVPVGTICHSLWLLCADRALLDGRRVTCAQHHLRRRERGRHDRLRGRRNGRPRDRREPDHRKASGDRGRIHGRVRRGNSEARNRGIGMRRAYLPRVVAALGTTALVLWGGYALIDVRAVRRIRTHGVRACGGTRAPRKRSSFPPSSRTRIRCASRGRRARHLRSSRRAARR